MEWIDCLNEAIRYIEEHLTEEIDYECLGKAACCLAYHFQRMFAYMAEVFHCRNIYAEEECHWQQQT